MAVHPYDPKQVSVTIGGVIMGGFADGEFVSVEQEEDSFNKVTGADGNTSRAKMNDKSGTLTLTLAQTSPSNDILSAFLAVDELTNAGILPVMIKDSGGTTLLFSATGWVRKPATTTYDKEITDREWEIDLADMNFLVGSNSAFV